MTTGGWINMLLSVGFVTVLFTYCIVRVVKGPGARKDHDLARVEPVDKTHLDQR